MALRLGLVGHGRWGRNIERTLLSFPDVSLKIIAKGEPLSTDFDGVLIATQSATHASAALPYIEAGIATFIEKPMSTSVADAECIRNAAKRSSALVFVGHIFLHHPAFLAALELLPSLGAILNVLFEGKNNKPRTDSSVLWDWLPHALSMARSIFARDPENVSAWNLSDNAMPRAAVVKFHYGVTPLVATTSWLSPTPRMRMTVACEKGILQFDDTAEQKLTLRVGNGEELHPECSKALPLTQELGAFLRAMKSGNPDSQQIEAGCAVVRAIAAAQQSIDLSGKPVEI